MTHEPQLDIPKDHLPARGKPQPGDFHFRMWMVNERPGLGMGRRHRRQIELYIERGYHSSRHWKECLIDMLGKKPPRRLVTFLHKKMPTMLPDVWRVQNIDEVTRLHFVEVVVSHGPSPDKLDWYHRLWLACQAARGVEFEAHQVSGLGFITPLMNDEVVHAMEEDRLHAQQDPLPIWAIKRRFR